MATQFRFAPGGQERLFGLQEALEIEYGSPEHHLANKQDPIDEAVYILLSFQTDLNRFKSTWKSLRTTFPDWGLVEAAPVNEVADCLRDGGLQYQKAQAIKRLLRAIRSTFGELSLESLRPLSDHEAELVLTSLPGLSWKSSRCILLYSFDRATFPIDSNSFRILKRVGVIPRSSIYRRRSLHDGLQRAVSREARRRFHINLVVHGQKTCMTKKPSCLTCCAFDFCLQRELGIKQEINQFIDSKRQLGWRDGIGLDLLA